MASTIQGIALLISRYLLKSFDDMVGYLNKTTLGSKHGLKVVMDRWLLHQPRFIGKLTKNITYLALMRIFASKSAVFRDLLVLGYDPSHTKDSPEVYTPLKILSTLVRCYQNELKNPLTSNKDLRGDEVAEKYRLIMEGLHEDGRIPTYDGADDDDEADGGSQGMDEEDLDPHMAFNSDLDVDFCHTDSCPHPA